MTKKKYTMSFSIKGSTVNRIEIESMDIFKDSAQWMAKVAKNSKYPGTFTITRNADQNYEEFWLKSDDRGFFITQSKSFHADNLEDEVDIGRKSYYMTCLDEKNNEYKYYTAQYFPSKGIVLADFGRLGQPKGTCDISGYVKSKDGQCNYLPKMFWVKYYEKLEKGYTDVTELKDFRQAYLNKKDLGGVSSDLHLPDNMVGNVIQKLINAQNATVKANYDLSIPSSEKAIRKAEMLLQKMFDMAVNIDDPSFDEAALRSAYKELLITVPRKIADVSAYLQNWNKDASSDRYLLNVLDEEQKLLQNFVDVYQREHNKAPEQEMDAERPSILTQNGLTADFPDYREKWEMEDRLCSPNGHGQIEDKRHYMSALIKVSNEKTQARYDNYVQSKNIDEKHQHLLFHGSESKNWWSIYLNGLTLRARVANGSMFGHGLYFAPLSRKSLGYTNFQGAHWTGGQDRYGYLALFKIAIKNPFYTSRTGAPPLNYDGVWAKASAVGLQNDEVVIYNESQCSIQYLYEMDSTRHTFKNITYESARTLICLAPVYDDKEKTITTVCNLSEIIPGVEENCLCVYHYDDKLCHFSDAGIESRLYPNEREYLTEVFASNFAKGPKEFQQYLQRTAGEAEKAVGNENISGAKKKLLRRTVGLSHDDR